MFCLGSVGSCQRNEEKASVQWRMFFEAMTTLAEKSLQRTRESMNENSRNERMPWPEVVARLDYQWRSIWNKFCLLSTKWISMAKIYDLCCIRFWAPPLINNISDWCLKKGRGTEYPGFLSSQQTKSIVKLRRKAMFTFFSTFSRRDDEIVCSNALHSVSKSECHMTSHMEK
jgi:hypothetical protein